MTQGPQIRLARTEPDLWPQAKRELMLARQRSSLVQGMIEVLVPFTSQVGLRLVVIDITLHQPDP
jgi:hypothetical protein